MNVEHQRILEKNLYRLENIDYTELIQYIREYKIFNRFMWNDIHSIYDLLALLPTRGPKAFWNFIEVLRKANYNTEADFLEKSTFESSELHFYKMSTIPLGYCLIINNMKFYPEEDYRHGSDVDAKSLADFFVKAGFKVDVESNLTSDQMKNCLLNFSKKDFTKVDSMILVILSHGSHQNNRDILYGIDWCHLYKDEILSMFDNKNCGKLQTKPKMFFFVACRGTFNDYGVPMSLPQESFDSKAINNNNIHLMLPTLSDTLVINSSLPYNVTVRDHESGTYFCQALVSVFNEYYKLHDLETMIKLVSKKLEGVVSEFYRIIPAAPAITTYMLKKKVMLCRRN